MKQIVCEPALCFLRIVYLLQLRNFQLRIRRRQIDIAIWPTNVAIPFGDLIFEDQMVPKCVPGEFADDPGAHPRGNASVRGRVKTAA